MNISIITVSYNSSQTIARTIESVLAQTYTDFEYLIIDGLSTDSTVEIAKRYEHQFESKGIPYRIISEKDKGMYDAINKGTRLAAGKIIGSINSDDWLEPNALQLVAKTYDETHFDMFYADLRIIKPTGNIVKHAKLSKFVFTRYWNHPTTFITKELYGKYQYKLESMYDDCDLMLRIRKEKSNKVVIKNEVIANFTFGGMSTKKSWKETWSRIKLRCKIYKNNGYGLLYYIDSFCIEALKFLLA